MKIIIDTFAPDKIFVDRDGVIDEIRIPHANIRHEVARVIEFVSKFEHKVRGPEGN